MVRGMKEVGEREREGGEGEKREGRKRKERRERREREGRGRRGGREERGKEEEGGEGEKREGRKRKERRKMSLVSTKSCLYLHKWFCLFLRWRHTQRSGSACAELGDEAVGTRSQIH